jgi:hypothetical protein
MRKKLFYIAFLLLLIVVACITMRQGGLPPEPYKPPESGEYAPHPDNDIYRRNE